FKRIEEATASSLATPKKSNVPLIWGTKNIGLGLLKALRSRQLIVFDAAMVNEEVQVPTDNGHLIICEDGNEHAQVIAANYAYALGAGLLIVPQFDKERAKVLLHHLYGL